MVYTRGMGRHGTGCNSFINLLGAYCTAGWALFVPVLILLFSTSACAETMELRYGIGANLKQKEARTYDALYLYPIGDSDLFFQGTNIGYYTPPGSWYLFRVYGLQKRFSDFQARIMAGMGAVTKSGPRITSGLQFTEEISLKYKNFGLSYKHISNAGLKKPNLGRDYLLFSLGFEF